MFKYYVSKHYRRTYDDLSQLGLLSDSFSISYSAYENYAREQSLSNCTLDQHIEILSSDKSSPIKIIKSLLFMHALLQFNHHLQDFEPFYQFMNHVLSCSREMVQKIRAGQRAQERKTSRAKSAVYGSDMKSENVQCSKEIFLLQSVVKPYVLYLQKIVSVFSFYASLAKTLYRTLATAQVWILLNLFKCAYSVTLHLPTITMFIRKSFNPIAQGLAQAFNIDFNNFYPKIYRYINQECNEIESRFVQREREFGEMQAYRLGVDGLEDCVNILQDISELNRELNVLYGEPTQRVKANIYRPKLVNLADEQFEFVLYLDKMKKCPDLGSTQTPKFFRTHQSRPSEATQQDREQKQGPELVPVFRDISNQEDNVCTFRKEECQPQRQVHLMPRYKKKQ